jgi:hypothetical protein
MLFGIPMFSPSKNAAADILSREPARENPTPSDTFVAVCQHDREPADSHRESVCREEGSLQQLSKNVSNL